MRAIAKLVEAPEEIKDGLYQLECKGITHKDGKKHEALVPALAKPLKALLQVKGAEIAKIMCTNFNQGVCDAGGEVHRIGGGRGLKPDCPFKATTSSTSKS